MVLLVGSLIVGWIAGPRGMARVSPFVIEQPLARRMEKRLGELGATGYTLFSQASGGGDRGPRRGCATRADECSW